MIQFHIKKLPTEIKIELDQNDPTHSFITAKTWAAEFKRGRTSEHFNIKSAL